MCSLYIVYCTDAMKQSACQVSGWHAETIYNEPGLMPRSRLHIPVEMKYLFLYSSIFIVDNTIINQ